MINIHPDVKNVKAVAFASMIKYDLTVESVEAVPSASMINRDLTVEGVEAVRSASMIKYDLYVESVIRILEISAKSVLMLVSINTREAIRCV